jgi:hypothetical protein
MSKSLKARCIRRWEVEFKQVCDSKVNPYWRKRHLRGYIRDCALITADCMVERMAEDNARVDFFGHAYGWYRNFPPGMTNAANSTAKRCWNTSMRMPPTKKLTKKFRTNWRHGMINSEQIQALKAAAEKATPGEWKAEWYDDERGYVTWFIDLERQRAAFFLSDSGPELNGYGEPTDFDKADCNFIAAANPAAILSCWQSVKLIRR